MAGMRSRHRMRCRPCRAKGAKKNHGHFTLRRAPKHYKRAPCCPRCKSLSIVSVEEARRRTVAKRDTCYCERVPHPHKRGTHALCKDYKGSATKAWTDQDFEDYSRQIFDPKNGKHRRTTFS